MWYSVWLGYALKGFFVNWLTRHQAIRVAWLPVTGPAAGFYLCVELLVIGAIVRQAWRVARAVPAVAPRPSAVGGMVVLSPMGGRDVAPLGAGALVPWALPVGLHWRVAFLYEWYSLEEIGLSLVHPRLWTSAIHQMWGVPALGHSPGQALAIHVGFVAFYAFMHHGLPLLVLSKLSRQAQPLPAA